MTILNKSYENFTINYVLFRKIFNYENFFFDEWYDDIKKIIWLLNIKNKLQDFRAYKVTHISVDEGFWCINEEQPNGQDCADFAVAFCCPQDGWIEPLRKKFTDFYR